MHKSTINKILYLVLFFLPWQSRYIFSEVLILGDITEYGKLSVYAVEVLLLIVILLRGRPRPIWGSEHVSKSIYILLGAVFFSLTFSNEYNVSLNHVMHLIFAAGLFLTLCDERTDVKNSVIAFVAGLCVPAVLGIIQVFTGLSPSSTLLGMSFLDASTAGVSVVEQQGARLLRAYGSFSHPNIFGGYLTVVLICLAWLVRFVSKKVLYITTVPVVLFSSVLILTFSRSAWLGLVISFLWLILLMVYRKKIPSKNAYVIIFLGCIALLSTLFFFHSSVLARFQPDLYTEAISINERVGQYSEFGDVFFINPFFGVGPGNYVFSLSDLMPGLSVWSYQPIHNSFLLIMTEIGVIGVAALLYFMIRVDQVNSKYSKTAGGMFAITLALALFVIALFDHYVWSMWSGLSLYAFAFAMVVRWSLLEKNGSLT